MTMDKDIEQVDKIINEYLYPILGDLMSFFL